MAERDNRCVVWSVAMASDMNSSETLKKSGNVFGRASYIEDFAVRFQISSLGVVTQDSVGKGNLCKALIERKGNGRGLIVLSVPSGCLQLFHS